MGGQWTEEQMILMLRAVSRRLKDSEDVTIRAPLVNYVREHLLQLPPFDEHADSVTDSTIRGKIGNCRAVFNAVRKLSKHYVKGYDVYSGCKLSEEHFDDVFEEAGLNVNNNVPMIKHDGLTPYWQTVWPAVVELMELQPAQPIVIKPDEDSQRPTSRTRRAAVSDADDASPRASHRLAKRARISMCSVNGKGDSGSSKQNPEVEPKSRVQVGMSALDQFGLVMSEIEKHEQVKRYITNEIFLRFYVIAVRSPGLSKAFPPLLDIDDPQRILLCLQAILNMAEA
ncbi:hypothetical protein E5Q_02014 [Mixia osmundae IAM 14324]|uniref:Uncharacterized protein n=2 Tax=Mixia osmundae (strain CBS 9802 / IAM 14324 / JCM 22182 / KY 12970) TaxID=764103 RepID=G7DXP7_MIXOS|nr:hypothetical protein E5Q_02014 [Mixia osmundae IAM 14324]